MTLAEFKAWFEGYTEGLEAAPTKAQFDRIKEKVKEIDGAPVTPIYIDRYVEKWPGQRPLWPYVTCSSVGATDVNYAENYKAYVAQFASFVDTGETVKASFDGLSAMYALGRAEALN